MGLVSEGFPTVTSEERKTELKELIDCSDPKDLDVFTVHYNGVSAKERIDRDDEVYALKMIDEICDRIISRCHHRIRRMKNRNFTLIMVRHAE